MPDAHPVPSLAAQLRLARHRRERRRAAFLVLVAAFAILVGARLVAGAGAKAANATSAFGTTTPAPPATAAQATGLDPGLVDAFGRAQAEAADAGHKLTITSGFRTAQDQAAMLDAEIAKRGSLEEALWWVFSPERSMHVQGLAIDVGGRRAAAWLADEGARFGICHTLGWEWWHFEWRHRWEAAGSCPRPAQVPEDAPQR